MIMPFVLYRKKTVQVNNHSDTIGTPSLQKVQIQSVWKQDGERFLNVSEKKRKRHESTYSKRKLGRKR